MPTIDLGQVVGNDGVSPQVSITDIDNGHRVSITDSTHPSGQSFDVLNGDPAVVIEGDSGPIVSFSDGADGLPVKSLIADINLIQDLHGYDNPWPAGGGKNLFDKDNASVVAGYISIDDFVTANQNAKTVYISISPNTTYTVSKQAGQRFAIATAQTIPSSGATFTVKTANNIASNLTITSGANDAYLWAWVFLEGTDTGTLADMLATVQIEVGSRKTAYAPYSNICSIEGFSALNLYRYSKNLFPVYTSGRTGNVDYTVAEDGVITLNGLCNHSMNITLSRFLPSGTYSLCDFAEGTFPDNARSRTQVYTPGYSQSIANNADSNDIITMTLQTSKVVEFRVRVDEGHNYDNCKVKPMLVLGQPTSMIYEPYSGTTIPITFPDPPGTVYGGTLDVQTGKLTVNRAIITMDGTTSIYGVTYSSSTGLYAMVIAQGVDSINTAVGNPHIWSNRFKNSSAVAIGNSYVTSAGKAIVAILPDQTITTKANANAWFEDNPTQFVYDLATPVVYDLTPHQVVTLLGQNNFWVDTGDINVSIYADQPLFPLDSNTPTALNGVLAGNGFNVTLKPVDSTPTASSTNLITSGGVRTALGLLPRPNLIDNWCFVNLASIINQRGKSSYDGAIQYTIDRWKTSNANTVVSIGSGYLGIVASSSSATPYLLQVLDNGDLLWGRKVTLSLLANDASTFKLFMATSTLPSSPPSSITTYCSISGYGQLIYMNSKLYVRLLAATGSESYYKAVKLEIGDFQTLAYNDSNGWHLLSLPNYQEELSKCQQHLVEVTYPTYDAYSFCGMGEGVSTSQAVIYCTLPVTLRKVVSTVTTVGSFVLVNGITTYAVTDIAHRRTCGNVEALTVTVSGTPLTVGQHYLLRASNDSTARLLISAEP